MHLQLTIDGTTIRRGLVNAGFGTALPALSGKSATGTLQDWASQYERAVRSRADDLLLPIGREMFAWLDAGNALRDWLLTDPRELIVTVAPGDAADLADALLAAPWELLADKDGFLARDTRLFSVARQAHGVGAPTEPSFRDISLLFMAAAPQGQTALDYEREEAVILEATRPRLGQPAPVHLQVEESGELEFLAETARLQGPFEALHLSCHGNIQPQANGGQPLPVVYLEDAEGKPDAVTVDRLRLAFDVMPPLLFLSACRTAERGTARGLPLPVGYREGAFSSSPDNKDAGRAEAESGPDLADPFARQISAFTPNVIGWDGSVYDSEAMLFAQELYRELSKGDSVPKAAAKARRALLRQREDNPSERVLGSHWHLARVYLGPGGGAQLCDPRSQNGRPVRSDTGQAFLGGDRRVPVASRDAFVGRKRELKRIIGTYRQGAKGVVAHGMGNLGKSSLAARVADRMNGYRIVVVYGACTERTLFEALKTVIQAIADGKELSESRRILDDLAEYERIISTSPPELENVLRRLFAGILNDQPVLLVLDDFEQSLENPTAETQAIIPGPSCLPAVRSLLSALGRSVTRSRLLVTSRFDFVVPTATGGDLAAGLERVALVPMERHDRVKQVRARARVENKEADILRRESLVHAALEASAGNPGLQDVLTNSILNGEEMAANAALAQIKAFRNSGTKPPTGTDLGDFFTRMAFDQYSKALSQTQSVALGAAAVFSEAVPIPETALRAAILAAGVADATAALARLVALGLVDDWGQMSAWPSTAKHPHFAVNPLARTLGTAVTPNDMSSLVGATLPELSASLRDKDGDFPRDPRGLEAARLAMAAPDPDPAVLDAAAAAGVIFLFDISDHAAGALHLGQIAVDRLQALNHPPGAMLIGKLVNAARLIGAVETQERMIKLALDRDDLSALDRGQFLALSGDRSQAVGDIAPANARYAEAIEIFRKLGAERQIAITRGKIADILQAQGDLAEARRIREQEQLPVYEALGDRRSVAVTRGKIADILQAQGDLAVARRIHEQEQLPVFEALGDRRSVAVTRGKIADILQAQGDLAEARRIREQEQLPVYEALGDRRSVAVTRGKIADILQAQGDLEGALAMHLYRLADAQAMKDIDSIAHSRFSCAQIRLQRGDHEGGGMQTIADELLEAFAIVQHLRRADGIGGIGALLGQVLAMGGHAEEAVKVLTEAKEAFAKLGVAAGVAQCEKLITLISGKADR